MRKSKTAHPGRLFPDPYEAAVVLELTIASFDSQSNQVSKNLYRYLYRIDLFQTEIHQMNIPWSDSGKIRQKTGQNSTADLE